MNEKERLLKVLKGDRVDRPPVICPGGMMSACVTEISDQFGGGHHADLQAMVAAAVSIHELTGFENLGVPFCLTAEVEPLGTKVNLGDNKIEPRITHYNDTTLEEIMDISQIDVSSGRMGIVLKAISKIKNNEIPVIGNVSGHISTATSAIDPLVIFKMLRREPEKITRFFEYLNDYLVRYALAMVEAGADVIAVSDPTATGEILGPKNFEKFAAPFYKEMIAALHRAGVPVIMHICGNALNIIPAINSLNFDAVSFDSLVNMKIARQKLNTRLMGNISTQLLHVGEKEKILATAQNAIYSGVDIVAPACGLSMATPVSNLKALTDYVKKGIFN